MSNPGMIILPNVIPAKAGHCPNTPCIVSETKSQTDEA